MHGAAIREGSGGALWERDASVVMQGIANFRRSDLQAHESLRGLAWLGWVDGPVTCELERSLLQRVKGSLVINTSLLLTASRCSLMGIDMWKRSICSLALWR
jgi:hypothetical protein